MRPPFGAKVICPDCGAYLEWVNQDELRCPSCEIWVNLTLLELAAKARKQSQALAQRYLQGEIVLHEEDRGGS